MSGGVLVVYHSESSQSGGPTVSEKYSNVVNRQYHDQVVEKLQRELANLQHNYDNLKTIVERVMCESCGAMSVIAICVRCKEPICADCMDTDGLCDYCGGRHI
jgi:hypothetical protein